MQKLRNILKHTLRIITQLLTQIVQLRRHYPKFTNKLQKLRKYAEVTQIIYAIITQSISKDYEQITQRFTRNTQMLRKYIYAWITQSSYFYAAVLRRYYVITQK